MLRAGYDPVLYGNYLLIHGQSERRSYFYAHMIRPAPVHRGDRVWAGERVGRVGKTGNARTVGCHLHFEIHVHGRPIDPQPTLETLGTPGLTTPCGASTSRGFDRRHASRGCLRPGEAGEAEAVASRQRRPEKSIPVVSAGRP